MAATDGQIVVAAARWADEPHSLREFVAKHPLPAVVKIIKGQYGGLGVPTLPSPGLQSSALLVSAGRRHKLAAQAVKLKEGRRAVCVGPRLAIPDSYAGFFELLSEDGRAGRCIDSVAELARRRPEAGVLVRESVRAVLAKLDADGGITADGARTVAVGETLVPVGEATLGKGRYLQCRDARGDTLLLGLEQRARFSPLAREDHISGVHTARNLLHKRLPLTVRLVHGSAPRGLKSPAHFVPELRLLATFEEEHVFALPLGRGSAVVALPLAAPLRLQRTRNADALCGLREFARLVERSGRLAADVADRIHVLDKLDDARPSAFLLRRSASSDAAVARPKPRDENQAPGGDYDEIDQIYDYVRGFAPLPKSITPPARPEPPPIETIPSKKPTHPPKGAPKAEKRTRRGEEKPGLFVKNTQRGRLLRQKSEAPLKESSPVFSVRYKSLSNLAPGMEMDGTLDSSHSGGRTSGDSGTKLPEKRSRRLSRPRSLTNLVWELRSGVVPPPPSPPPPPPPERKKLSLGGHRSSGTLYL